MGKDQSLQCLVDEVVGVVEELSSGHDPIMHPGELSEQRRNWSDTLSRGSDCAGHFRFVFDEHRAVP
jgi:hypothetical protein